MSVTMVLALLCGLALFLYGVTLLGDGLNKIAGGKFEAILARLIGSPFKSVLIGAVFSAIVQSSTATSIIAIGFLNSGMMELGQAAYMILGSILGSSVTGWIVLHPGKQGHRLERQSDLARYRRKADGCPVRGESDGPRCRRRDLSAEIPQRRKRE